MQEDDETQKENLYATYSDMQIKWPKGLGDFFCSEQVKDHHDDDCTTATTTNTVSDDGQTLNSAESVTRPDSGVGESVSVLIPSRTVWTFHSLFDTLPLFRPNCSPTRWAICATPNHRCDCRSTCWAQRRPASPIHRYHR